MNKLEQAAAARSERRVQIEPLVRDYPDLTKEQRSELIEWYRREASSFDVAMLANKNELCEGYQRFRADHIERVTMIDYVKVALFLLGVLGILAGLAWLSID